MILTPPENEHKRIIQDSHGRIFNTLRLAINERCNLRCLYCMSEDMVFPPDKTLLNPLEIDRLVKIVSGLGVKKIRFTGGEPLLHPSIISIVRSAAKTTGVKSVHLTTNGVLLERYSEALKEAGLQGVNISIDSLSAETFKKITRRNQFNKVMAGINSAIKTGFKSVKINVVAMRGTTESELSDFVEFTRTRPITVRFIELMPFDDQQIWKTGQFLRSDVLVNELMTLYPKLLTSQGGATEHRVFRLPKGVGKIAIIPAYSRNICQNCNRFRITADGRLRNCLYAKREVDIRKMLRGQSSNSEIAQAILDTMHTKLVDGWAAQREMPTVQKPRKSMSQIGG